MAQSIDTLGSVDLQPRNGSAALMLPEALAPYSDVLHRVALTVNSSLALKDTLKSLGNLALEAIPADRCHLFLLDESGTRLMPTFSLGRVTDIKLWNRFRNLEPIDLKGVPSRWETFSAGHAVGIPDTAASPIIPPQFVEVFGSRAAILVPLKAAEERLGLFSLDWVGSGREIEYEEIQLAEAIGAYAGLAIRNANLYESIASKALILERLVDVAGALNSSLSLRSVLDLICEAYEELFDTVHVSVNLVDETRPHWVKTLAVRGVPWFIGKPQMFQAVSRREIKRVTELWTKMRVPVSYPDVDQLSVIDRSMIPSSIRSGALFPLLTAEKVTGFVVAALENPGGVSREGLETGQALADQAATAIGRAQLHDKLQQRLQRVEILSRLTDVVVGTTGLSRAVRRLNGFLRPELGISLRSISIANPQVRAAVGAREPMPEELEAIRSWRATLAKTSRVPKPREFDDTVLVPVVHGNRVQGVLRLAFEATRPPEEELLAAIATGCGEVIYKAGLRRDLADTERRLVIAAERDRIARDLHDSVGQILHGMGLRLSQYLPEAPDEIWRDRLEELHGLANQGNVQVRESIRALLFLDVRRKGLVRSLRDLAAKFSANTGIDVTVRLDGKPVTIPADHEEALFRVVHEALMNVERHARAEFAVITLRYTRQELSVAIRDDGVGLAHRDPFETKGPHFGLRGIQRLLNDGGGELTVKNASPRGVLVEARMPIARNGRYRGRASGKGSGS